MEQQTIAINKLEQFLTNIKALKELRHDKPKVDILKSYRGFGGLRQCFNSKQLYAMLMNELRGIFGSSLEHDIFNSIRHSCTSAYYTPVEVVSFMYKYLTEVCHFNGGDILEPSCGNGVFFEHMPESIKANSNVTGIEFDTLTSKLVQNIYKDVTIINNGLQDIDFANKKYDLIIGNPPYGKETIVDKNMSDISGYTIHHYFMAKCVRLLKDNGILAFVMPSYYMDIPHKNTRAIVNNEAVLIDVIRLPDNLFAQASVTVDIVFVRKSGNQIHNFVNTVPLEQHGNKDCINEYWAANPKRILGELKLKWVEAYHRYVPTCYMVNINQILTNLTNCKFSDKTRNNYHSIVG